MARRLIWLGCMLWVGCDNAPATDKGTADTSVPDTDTDTDTPGTDCPTPYTGPVIVTQATVVCDGADTVRYYVQTEGWTADGLVDAMETANNTPWDDEHDILSYEYDACGFEDNLERTLATGASPQTWAANIDTVFTCASHFDDANGVMTYAARVNDLDDNFADCLAWGHDPQGYVDGLYDAACINCPSEPAQLSQCVVARRAR